MLRRTFIHLEGIGAATERALWAAGVADWDALRDPHVRIPRMGRARRDQLSGALDRCEERLARGDARFFGGLLSSSERWRLLPEFTPRVAFVDIETTGMGSWAETTVIGMYAAGRATLFVRGANLDAFPSAIEPYDVWVSYNGICFDAPFLIREFGARVAPAAHIDLMYVLRAVGLKGGLKGVERQVGTARDDDVRDLDGWDAVRLWREFAGGRVDSLRTLVRYNLEDVLNLEILLEIGVNRHIATRELPFEPIGCPGTPDSRSRAAKRAVAELGARMGLW